MMEKKRQDPDGGEEEIKEAFRVFDKVEYVLKFKKY